MKLPRLPAGALTHLDMMRGVAAVAVAAFHVRSAMLVDYDELKQPGFLVKCFYVLTGFGHQAVVVFFVLSGLFIGTSVLSASAAGTFSWRSFLVNRLTRLYMVLIPALVLTLFWDQLGMHLFGSEGNIYAGVAEPAGNYGDVRRSIGPSTFAANLFFLQTLYTQPYGSNTPLWSLSLEFWIYILFPLVLLGILPQRGQQSGRQRAAMLGLAAGLLLAGAYGPPHTPTQPLIVDLGMRLFGKRCFGERGFAFFAGIWLLGAVAARSWPRIRLEPALVRSLALFGSAALFVATLLIGRLGLLGSTRGEDLLLGVGTTAFVLALLSGDRPGASQGTGWRVHYARVAALLASCSYTVYLVHFPVIVFAHAGWFQAGRWAPTAGHVATAAIFTIALVLLYGYPLSRLTEARTDEVRRWVTRRVFPSQSGSQ